MGQWYLNAIRYGDMGYGILGYLWERQTGVGVCWLLLLLFKPKKNTGLVVLKIEYVSVHDGTYH